MITSMPAGVPKTSADSKLSTPRTKERMKALVVTGVPVVRGKAALRAYWTAALEHLPHLRFDVRRVLWKPALVPYVRSTHTVRTMTKTLTRTGNSLALVLDKALLEATGIDADTPLEVSTDGDVILISPVRTKKRTARLKRIMADLDTEHAGAFRRLAR